MEKRQCSCCKKEGEGRKEKVELLPYSFFFGGPFHGHVLGVVDEEFFPVTVPMEGYCGGGGFLSPTCVYHRQTFETENSEVIAVYAPSNISMTIAGFQMAYGHIKKRMEKSND